MVKYAFKLLFDFETLTEIIFDRKHSKIISQVQIKSIHREISKFVKGLKDAGLLHGVDAFNDIIKSLSILYNECKKTYTNNPSSRFVPQEEAQKKAFDDLVQYLVVSTSNKVNGCRHVLNYRIGKMKYCSME